MAEAADVRSIDALRDVRAAVHAFAEEAKNALADVDFDIRRTLDWLQNDQRLFWQAELRRWQQNLQIARADLARKKLGRFLDHKPDTSQEEKAVRRAEERIEEAQKKLELLKKWVPELLHAVQEYRGSSQPLASLVDVEMPRAVARIDRMLEALEAYLQMAAPRTEGVGRSERPAAVSGESMARGEATGTTDDERQRGLEQAEPGDEDTPREVGQHRG
jgi:hypothetical protein